LLEMIFCISRWASFIIYFAYSVSSFWDINWAVRIVFYSVNLLISSFIESIRKSCFFLSFSRETTFSSPRYTFQENELSPKSPTVLLVTAISLFI
jgi:hypothetical protein